MFVLVVGVGLLMAWVFGAKPPAVAKIGQIAPDFTVETLHGDQFTLSEQKGKTVVLNLWASWCPPCRTEMPDISAFAAAHPDIVVIGVAVRDTEEAAREFADQVEPSYPLAMGARDFENAYPNLGLPATYVIDEDGRVSEVHNGIVDAQTLSDLIG